MTSVWLGAVRCRARIRLCTSWCKSEMFGVYVVHILIIIIIIIINIIIIIIIIIQ